MLIDGKLSYSENVGVVFEVGSRVVMISVVMAQCVSTVDLRIELVTNQNFIHR